MVASSCEGNSELLKIIILSIVRRGRRASLAQAFLEFADEGKRLGSGKKLFPKSWITPPELFLKIGEGELGIIGKVVMIGLSDEILIHEKSRCIDGVVKQSSNEIHIEGRTGEPMGRASTENPLWERLKPGLWNLMDRGGARKVIHGESVGWVQGCSIGFTRMSEMNALSLLKLA